MDSHIYDLLYHHEKTYWWSVARRNLVMDTWRRISEGRSHPRVLDAGCGTGAMLEEIQSIGHGFGIDFAREALRYCAKHELDNLLNSSVDQLPFKPSTFDLIFCLDVIEHLTDDARVLHEFYRILNPRGCCIITVPGCPLLWSTRDVRLNHKRRYTKRELVKKIEASGFTVVKCSYFSVFYFPVLAGLILFQRIFKATPHISTDVATVPSLLNRLFLDLLTLESFLLRWINYPIGVSLICIAIKAR